MLAHRLIERKRDGMRIMPDEWAALMQAYTAGEIPDYQMAALLMASYIRGLDRDEAKGLTGAMLESGGSLDATPGGLPRVDKHSTGGVGDKVSLVLAPVVSCLGVAVPMISGRALGHTGGTLDKLGSIPGFRADLTLATARVQLDRIGCVMMGQTPEIAPADQKLYALRDATSTIDSLPLIAASIMSKKLAEGLTGLVVDITPGSGSFIADLPRALELADLMIAIGAEHGCPTVALITAMDRPLGRACGNALEVEEAILALKGEGPADFMEVTYALGAEMLVLASVAHDVDAARRALEQVIATGRGAEQFQRIIAAQGGNPAVVDDPGLLPQAAECELYAAPRRGFVARVEPRAIGRGVVELGGGRTTIDQRIEPAVGFVVTARPGDWVEAGEPLATIFAGDSVGVDRGRTVLDAAIVIADEAELGLPLVSHRVGANGAHAMERE